jgi:hypothetical protein
MCSRPQGVQGYGVVQEYGFYGSREQMLWSQPKKMNIKGISSWRRQKEIFGEKSIFIVKNYKLRVRDASTPSNERCLPFFLSLKKNHAYARVCVSLKYFNSPLKLILGFNSICHQRICCISRRNTIPDNGFVKRSARFSEVSTLAMRNMPAATASPTL